jgi:hypothetical protein
MLRKSIIRSINLKNLILYRIDYDIPDPAGCNNYSFDQ